jgi:hypothetical protein
MLLRQALKELGPVAASLVAAPARRLMAASGMRETAVFFNRMLAINAARIIQHINPELLGSRLPRPLHTVLRAMQRAGLAFIPGAVVQGAFALYRGIAQPRQRTLTHHVGWTVSADELDELWSRLKDQAAVLAVRNAALLFARYRNEQYELIATRLAGRLVAWVVLRIPKTQADQRLVGLRIATLSDVLFPIDYPRLGQAVLAAAEQRAKVLGADGLLCSGTHHALQAVLRRRGYLPVPANLHLMTRDYGEFSFQGVAEHDLWFTRGDGQSDETF